MTTEQMWGVVIVLIGLYFLICAIWKQDFFLYQMKISRAADWFGEEAAHFIFGTIGFGMAVAGTIKLLGYF